MRTHPHEREQRRAVPIVTLSHARLARRDPRASIAAA
jgi:hypothetical protein